MKKSDLQKNTIFFITRVIKNKWHFIRHVGEELDFPRMLFSFRITMKKTNWLENKCQKHNCVKCENQKKMCEKLEIIIHQTLIVKEIVIS